jgi:hypothetical protein
LRSPGGSTSALHAFERKSFARDMQQHSRMESKPPFQSRILCQSAGSDGGDEDDDAPYVRKTPVRSPTAKSPTTTSNRKEKSRPPLSAGIVSARLKRLVRSSASSSGTDAKPEESSFGQVPVPSQLSNKQGSQGNADRQKKTSQRQSPAETVPQPPLTASTPLSINRKRPSSAAKPTTPQRPLSSKTPNRQDSLRSSVHTTFYAPMEQPRELPGSLENMPPTSLPEKGSAMMDSTTSPAWLAEETHAVDVSPSTTGPPEAKSHESDIIVTTPRRVSALPPDTPDLENAATRTRVASMASIASSVADAAQRSRAATLKTSSTPIKKKPPSTPVPASQPGLRKSASRPGGVKAMAAMWEGAAQDSPSATVKSKRRLTGTKSGDLVSPYRSNEVPVNKPSDRGTGGSATAAS